jgi:AraC family ethanolamine operon transcriptional activator
LVGRATTLISHNLGEPLRIGDVCRTLRISDRTLRAAFRDVVGMSPKRYVTMQRLGAAHDALRLALLGQTTVTDIALSVGFLELGRFAARYRRAFGEAPSQTLRRQAA